MDLKYVIYSTIIFYCCTQYRWGLQKTGSFMYCNGFCNYAQDIWIELDHVFAPIQTLTLICPLICYKKKSSVDKLIKSPVN